MKEKLNKLERFVDLKGINLLEAFSLAYKNETGSNYVHPSIVDDLRDYSHTKIVPYYVRSFLNDIEDGIVK